MEKNASTNARILMMKGDVVKEIDVDLLPKRVVKALEDAYDRTKVVGISRDTYAEMAETMAFMLSEYREELKNADDDMFRQAVSFANGFGIDSRDSRFLFDTFCWIDRNIAERGDKFTSKDVNSREIRSFLRSKYGRCTYNDMYRDFKHWARELFTSRGMKVGFVKLAKFYYSVVTNEQLQMA